MTSISRWVPPRIALAVFLASGAMAGWTLDRALTVETMPARAAHQSPRTAVAFAAAPGTVPARIVTAVRKDPFRAERKPPAERFRLPGEPLAAAAAQDSTRSPFQLVGTAVMPEGRGFAMCQLGAEPPRLVRIGEKVGELTLKKVAQGRAVFTSADGRRTELRVPKAGT